MSVEIPQKTQGLGGFPRTHYKSMISDLHFFSLLNMYLSRSNSEWQFLYSTLQQHWEKQNKYAATKLTLNTAVHKPEHKHKAGKAN